MDINPLGKVIAIALVVLLIFLFPLSYIAKAANESVGDLVDKSTTEFSDTARKEEVITKEMYEALIRDLDRTGDLYDVDIEVHHPVSGTEIAENELDNLLHNDGVINASYKGNKQSELVGTKNIKLDYIDSDGLQNNSRLSNSLPSLMSNKEEIQSLSAHTHTDACYVGHRHTSSCNGYVGNRDVPVVTYMLKNYSTNSKATAIDIKIQCRRCYKMILSITINDYEDNSKDTVNSNSVGFINNQASSVQLYYNRSNQANLDTIMNKAYTLYDTLLPYCTYTDSGGYKYAYDLVLKNFNIPSCFGLDLFQSYLGCCYCGGPTLAAICGQAQDENPICNQVITSLTPTNPTQTVKKGESIITTATVTYLDGSVGTVNCASNYNPNLDGPQTVTLSYAAYVDNAKNFVTIYRTITVTVISKVLTSISVSPTSQVRFRTNAPVFTVYANYSDGTNVALTPDKYSVSAYNPSTLGKQTLTISYTEGGETKTTLFDLYIDELTSITVSPGILTVERYTQPNALPITVMANSMYFPPWNVTGGHIISGYSSDKIGTQTVTVSYKYYDTTRTATIQVNVTGLHKTCPICGTVYELSEDDTDHGCPNCSSTVVGIVAYPQYITLQKGDPLTISVEAIYRNGGRSIVTGWTSNYDSSVVAIQDVTITYNSFETLINVEVINTMKKCDLCGLEYELNVDGTDPGCPICSKIVTGIEATPEVLTINKHETLPITVTGTFKDGHTEIINDWASNFIADSAGIYEVTILYKNVFDIIKVTVLEDGQIECPYCGLKYLFNDSPKGCPSCYVTLTGIEAYLRNGGTKVPYKSNLNLQISKIFKDEHRELTYTGWTVSDYNPNKLGYQTVTVHYDGFITQLEIEVVDDLPEVICPNGHTYYLNADGSDPGCPYCYGPEGKAESLFYFDTTHTKIIVDTIYTYGKYELKKGDYLKITIKPRNKSIISKLLSLFHKSPWKEFIFGGEVS